MSMVEFHCAPIHRVALTSQSTSSTFTTLLVHAFNTAVAFIINNSYSNFAALKQLFEALK